ncbi:hypothetical protein ASE35_04945 [Lysobacter sp. Root916]|uniref:hypothetical protein n=1 Tax=Lysobacter sp. Root916 TaxID=1736606 RepID=UPI00070B1606|nr:hypothetical protein [Lysobacter sp. Root916]KRD39682.1 hypothetical protein ASE35_04945 [Lysobacter sp. Root916]
MNPAYLTPEFALAALLALAVLAAWTGLVLRQARAPAGGGARGWRLGLLLIAQPLGAILLYLALLPPRLPGEAGTMVVATQGIADFAEGVAGDVRVVLPEAPATLEGERVPDLATALRRHPGTRRLRVIGAGLEARDLDAASGLAIEFRPLPLPRGLTGLWLPRRIAAGDDFVVHARAHGLAGGSAELLDPAGQRVDRVAVDANGALALSGSARGAGLAPFRLRLLDAQRKVVQDVELPLSVAAQTAPRILILAGAPSPELKYLRRWALDSGADLHTQISVGGGLQLGDAPIALNATGLANFDLAVLDDRSWEGLGAAQRAALIEAMRNGLGVVLRATGPLSESTRAQWRALGFNVDAGREAATAKLALDGGADEDAIRARLGPGSADAPRARDEAVPETPVLSRRVLRLESPRTQTLLRDAGGVALAVWREQGRGRVALWTLTDSFRLALAGRGDLHARLWNDLLAKVARAQSGGAPDIDTEARPHRRMRLCGLSAGARVSAPDGSELVLPIDPASGAARCAAYWPRLPGWHTLRQGDRAWPFAVRSADEAPGLRAAALQAETLALAAQPSSRTDVADVAANTHRSASWPWFLAWLLFSAALWWFERSRLGRPPAAV